MFHYARITKDYEASEVDGPEVFHFVAIEGTDDWIEVQPYEPLGPEHEDFIREKVRDHLAETVSCQECGASVTGDGVEFADLDHAPDCTGEGKVTGTLTMRITRRFLRLQGADFVEIGE